MPVTFLEMHSFEFKPVQNGWTPNQHSWALSTREHDVASSRRPHGPPRGASVAPEVLGQGRELLPAWRPPPGLLSLLGPCHAGGGEAAVPDGCADPRDAPCGIRRNVTKALIRCGCFLLQCSPSYDTTPPPPHPHTPHPQLQAHFTASPLPDIALETRTLPQTSPYSHGVQELSGNRWGPCDCFYRRRNRRESVNAFSVVVSVRNRITALTPRKTREEWKSKSQDKLEIYRSFCKRNHQRLHLRGWLPWCP